MFQHLLSKLTNFILVMSLFMPGLIPASKGQSEPVSTVRRSSYPCGDGIIYDFHDGDQGWGSADYSKGYSDVHTLHSDNSPVGAESLSFNLDLNSHSSAEFLVNLSNDPPACAFGATTGTPLWEPGSILSVWVWAPTGTRGDPDYPNGLHLFAVDKNGRKIYGSWQNIQENKWFEVTLKLAQETPACGYMDSKFDPTKIRKLGINLALNSKKPVRFKDSIKMSGITIKRDELTPPISDHLYLFDNLSKENMFPDWQIYNQDWKAEAFSNISIQGGALAVDANFVIDKEDSGRKGFLGLIYAPALNLSTLDTGQDVFSLDIRFDSSYKPRVKCPFSLKLWVLDAADRKYVSDSWNVGSAGWTHVAFHLADFMFKKETPESPDIPLNISQIREIGIEVWGNDNYQGKVWFDNIALGGTTSLQTAKTIPFVEVNGPHFRLDGERFRFVGANAEYLPFVSDSIVKNVLDRAQSMGITVIRTWGFGDGCEDTSMTSCAYRSQYFQPAFGTYNNSAFEHFDRIVLEAKQRNIRLIVPLANNWGEHGGIPQYICWQEKYNPGRDSKCTNKPLPNELHDKFFTDEDVKDGYRAYLNYFVNHVNTLTGIRYADDPTIMAWELINEPRAKSDPSGAALHSWISEMSSYLAGLAPKQLIGTGEEGWFIMSKEAADKFMEWQSFPKNYWHYGVNWMDDDTKEYWGSNGVDFVSDNSSTPRTVTWQEMIGNNISSLSTSEERDGVSKVNFTTVHLYPAPGETNLPKAPYCEYYGLATLCSSFQGNYQAKEWIAWHVEISHKELNKPFILEEFNFPVIRTDPQGKKEPLDKSVFQVTPEERARLFTQYLDNAYDLDVDGIMFWDLGYQGFAEQPWSEIPSLTQWTIENGSGSVKMIPKGVDSVESLGSIRLNYSPNGASNEVTMQLTNPNVDWLDADGSRVTVKLYNLGDAQTAILGVHFTGGTDPITKEFPLKPGENNFTINELFEPPAQPGKVPLDVISITATLKNYAKEGSAYFDFRTIFNNKYVIYPDDPVEDVIRFATPRWQRNAPPIQPVVKINQAITCGTDIHPKIARNGIPIEFEIIGGIEHPDGYFYTYVMADKPLAQPHNVSQAETASIGFEQSARIFIQPKYAGYNNVSISVEGGGFDTVEFDSPGADSCSFNVQNVHPHLSIDELWIDDQPIQPPYDNVRMSLVPINTNRKIEIHVSGTDDVSSSLQVGCVLLNDNAEVYNGNLSCPSSMTATTKLGSTGNSSSISLQLPPGSYELQLWLEDEDSGKSEMNHLKITVPLPIYIYIIIIGLVLLIIFFLAKLLLGRFKD